MGGFLNILKSIFAVLKSTGSKVGGIGGTLSKGFNKLIEWAMAAGGAFVKFKMLMMAIIELLVLIPLAITAVSSVSQLWSLTQAVIDPSNYYMDLFSSMLEKLPSWSETTASVDATMTQATSAYWTPPITFTNIVSVFGLAHMINQVLEALIMSVAFNINMAVFRWSLSRLKFTYTRGI